PSPFSATLVRAGRRMAARLQADFLAAYVERPGVGAEALRQRAIANLRLAERLGAEAVVLSSPDEAHEIVRYARERNVTKIVVGKPTHPRWRDLLYGSFLDKVARASADVDVYVIAGSEADLLQRPVRRAPGPVKTAGYLWGLLVTMTSTGACLLMFRSFEL